MQWHPRNAPSKLPWTDHPRKTSLSLSQLESGGQGLRRIIELGKDSKEDEGRNITQIHQMFESERALKPTEQAPIFIDEKTKPQRRPVTHQVSLKLESLNSISGLLDQCSLGPRPLMCPPSAMAKALVVCPHPGHAPCLHPYGFLCVQQTTDGWTCTFMNLDFSTPLCLPCAVPPA